MLNLPGYSSPTRPLSATLFRREGGRHSTPVPLLPPVIQSLPQIERPLFLLLHSCPLSFLSLAPFLSDNAVKILFLRFLIFIFLLAVLESPLPRFLVSLLSSPLNSPAIVYKKQPLAVGSSQAPQRH